MRQAPRSDSSRDAFSQRRFRDALGHFPTGVAVIAAHVDAGYDIGMTVNSFCSVSLSPPLISFNIGRHLRGLPDLLECARFTVNLLTDEQAEISTKFSKAQTDKWQGVVFRRTDSDCPVLVPNLAMFECRLSAAHEAGDHMILVGEVLHLEVDPARRPLVFYRGGYSSLGRDGS